MNLAPAIVVCGGLCPRLRSVVANVLKPLVPMNGVPFLLRLLQRLRYDGVQFGAPSTGHLAEQVRAEESIVRLNAANLAVVAVTNHAEVARRYCAESEIVVLRRYMQDDLLRAGAHVDASCYSTYYPQGAVEAYRRRSAYRKPGDGMYRRAAADLRLDISSSPAVGDRTSDITPAAAPGCTPLLLKTGYGRREHPFVPEGTVVIPPIGDAVSHILASR